MASCFHFIDLVFLESKHAHIQCLVFGHQRTHVHGCSVIVAFRLEGYRAGSTTRDTTGSIGWSWFVDARHGFPEAHLICSRLAGIRRRRETSHPRSGLARNCREDRLGGAQNERVRIVYHSRWARWWCDTRAIRGNLRFPRRRRWYHIANTFEVHGSLLIFNLLVMKDLVDCLVQILPLAQLWANRRVQDDSTSKRVFQFCCLPLLDRTEPETSMRIRKTNILLRWEGQGKFLSIHVAWILWQRWDPVGEWRILQFKTKHAFI